jgi:hypothetical protein
VFGLQRPTADRPFIAGLLDPCTNSKLAPNIPAEVLYDKRVSWRSPDIRWVRLVTTLVGQAAGMMACKQCSCVILVQHTHLACGPF